MLIIISDSRRVAPNKTIQLLPNNSSWTVTELTNTALFMARN
jgi:hypothetical protein